MLATLSHYSQGVLRNLRPAVNAPLVLAGKRTVSTQPPTGTLQLSRLNLRSNPSPAVGEHGSWKPFKEAVKTSAKTPEEIWASREPTVKNLPRPNGPFIGRSWHVNRQTPVSQALGRLRSIIRYNNVAREVRLQARHEKKGYKRRRIESQRWRRSFAHEVRMKVQIVKEIRARGA
ncbi:uncharacterized protein PHACADRAFT_256044 [Phanerochaete carnosa HHB-10118-sp]|uniref:Uncharacterized protein n=1 Tax=Phanerochaete carnosa (strain HHB-10118-sp) TaxID=650164 RepID=K5W8C5_PHACS|nr:uncharacterized protein PHACADRAFT_256044 [Phanerochaete carnosa HHB-10118-sp]EKM55425.1 hypothetical protein PHACADRAFT_256044 [Phanerochaete carnosa HHB-10118-sp]